MTTRSYERFPLLTSIPKEEVDYFRHGTVDKKQGRAIGFVKGSKWKVVVLVSQARLLFSFEHHHCKMKESHQRILIVGRSA
jgi:hypothetical protein